MPITKEQDMTKELSHITSTNKKSTSIRTIIPKKVADDLALRVNDWMEWELVNGGGNKKYYKVKRLQL